MKKHWKLLVASFFAFATFLVSFYWICPPCKKGRAESIRELNQKNRVAILPEFSTEGGLLFVEKKRVFTNSSLVVLGKMRRDALEKLVNDIKNDPRCKLFSSPEGDGNDTLVKKGMGEEEEQEELEIYIYFPYCTRLLFPEIRKCFDINLDSSHVQTNRNGKGIKRHQLFSLLHSFPEKNNFRYLFSINDGNEHCQFIYSVKTNYFLLWVCHGTIAWKDTQFFPFIFYRSFDVEDS